jgi:hypothetical protein
MRKMADSEHEEEIRKINEMLEELEKVFGKPIPVSELLDSKFRAMQEIQLHNMERILSELATRKGESMKIKKIELKDYKLFKGKHVFKFNDKLNLVSGPCGSGKTILFNALKESMTKDVPGVKISLEGELEAFKGNLDLIFIDEEMISKGIDNPSLSDDRSTGSRNFTALMNIMIKRASAKKNLPLVMDANLAAMMTKPYLERFFALLVKLQTQIIMFEHDFRWVKGGKRFSLREQR